MKRQKTVYANLYGAEGQGRNKTEAKKDAIATIEKTFAGQHSPIIISWRGNIGLVWRELADVCSGVVVFSNSTPKNGPLNRGVTCHNNDIDGAARIMRQHIAQLGWTFADGESAPNILKDESEKDNFRRWARFQRKYRELRLAGVPETECHAQACAAC